MKKTILVLFLVFIVTFSAKAQVLITVADNATLEIKNGATLNALKEQDSKMKEQEQRLERLEQIVAQLD